ncbi:heme biosynthesis protein HemY [Thioclava kandeliae]|uniref:Heme biosynthesis HemY N-terminal domain-containing protein n=1 Tax=Thioclava kandeliae TaxID=3070818 RepID=A0ABV1SGP3_9RHOB
MLWSFIKIAVFLIAVTAVTYGAMTLASSADGVQVVLAGVEYNLGPVQAIIAVLVLIVAVFVFLKVVGFVVALLRFLVGDETALTRYFDRSRERRGYKALADGMISVASGEGRLAYNQAKKAQKLLGRPELTNLLVAQAAETKGDTKKATEAYKLLLSDQRTRFIGVRGLMRQKLAEGDTDTALALAQKAYALKPSHQDTQDTLLKLSTEKGAWGDARKVISYKRHSGLLPKDVAKRRDAVLALQEAKGILDEGASIEAQEAAIAANKSSPDLIPAAAMAARSYIGKGKPKNAERVIRKAWEAQPHPDLAAAYAAIAPEETPQARLKRFQKLLVLRPDHEETRLLRAELNIAAENFPEARRALGHLADTHPTSRVLAIMAAVERGEGSDDAVVRGWLARALTAPRGPQWCCDACQNIQSDWTPVCDNCGGFDTLSWREPPKTDQPLPHGAEMLPLIVGAPAVMPESEAARKAEEAGVEVEEAEIVTGATEETVIVTKPETEGDIAPEVTETEEVQKKSALG